MDINTKSPFFLTQALTPLLRKNASADRTSSVINIGSVTGLVGRGVDTFSYAASKAAIHQLTRLIATKLAPSHIRVNAIVPGWFHTKLTEPVSNDPAIYEWATERIPLQRWGSAPDLAGVAVMLAGQAGAYITGQIIVVDGGVSL